MEKSIEDIWKESFLTENNLIAPKITNLYNRKSQNIVDRMIRLMKWNVIAIYIFAAGFLIYSFFSSIPIVPAIGVFLLFIAAGWYSQNQMKKMKDIDQSLTSYNYLKSFDKWLRDQVNRNISLSRYFYPLTFLGAFSMVWFSEGRKNVVTEMLESFPNHYMIGDMPIAFLIVLIGVMSGMFIFAKQIYLFDVNLVYGRAFKKLNEIIDDFEELRS